MKPSIALLPPNAPVPRTDEAPAAAAPAARGLTQALVVAQLVDAAGLKNRGFGLRQRQRARKAAQRVIARQALQRFARRAQIKYPVIQQKQHRAILCSPLFSHKKVNLRWRRGGAGADHRVRRRAAFARGASTNPYLATLPHD
jgi:hypothetical protein